jgi:hypothetical protein
MGIEAGGLGGWHSRRSWAGLVVANRQRPLFPRWHLFPFAHRNDDVSREQVERIIGARELSLASRLTPSAPRFLDGYRTSTLVIHCAATTHAVVRAHQSSLNFGQSEAPISVSKDSILSSTMKYIKTTTLFT